VCFPFTNVGHAGGIVTNGQTPQVQLGSRTGLEVGRRVWFAAVRGADCQTPKMTFQFLQLTSERGNEIQKRIINISWISA